MSATTQFLTLAELCARWKTSRISIWRMRRDEKIKSHHLGRGGLRFSLEEIQKYEASAQS